MVVVFVLPHGVTKKVLDHEQVVVTNRGPIPAGEVRQNDYVRFSEADGFVRVSSPPFRVEE